MTMDRFEDSFEELFTRSYRVAHRIVLGPAEAEDIAAETMTRAYLSWRRLHDSDHREAWVIRVTTNLAIDVLRKRGRDLPEPAVSTGGESAAELRDLLLPALKKLPKRQRE